MECYHSSKSTLTRIFPIFMGTRIDISGAIGNLFNEKVYQDLSNNVPTASINAVNKLLMLNNIQPREELFTTTVRGIVNEMKKFLCLFAWNICNPSEDTAESVDQILGVLRSLWAEKMKIKTGIHCIRHFVVFNC